MIQKVILGTLFILLFAAVAQARNPKDSIQAHSVFVGPFIGLGATSTLIDRSGTEVSKLYDTIHYSKAKDTVYEYGFDQNNYTFGLEAEYYPLVDLSVSSRLSFLYHEYTERYSDNTHAGLASKNRFTKSYTKPLSLDFGCRYRLVHSYIGDLYLTAGATVDLFKGDSAYDPLIVHIRNKNLFYGGLQYDYLAEKYFLSGSVAFNARDIEPKSQIFTRLEAGLKSISDTRISAFFEMTTNLKGDVGTLDIDPRFLPQDENHGFIGAEFSLIIGKSYYAGLSYSTTVFGKNTLSGGNGYIRLGVIF